MIPVFKPASDGEDEKRFEPASDSEDEDKKLMSRFDSAAEMFEPSSDGEDEKRFEPPSDSEDEDSKDANQEIKERLDGILGPLFPKGVLETIDYYTHVPTGWGDFCNLSPDFFTTYGTDGQSAILYRIDGNGDYDTKVLMGNIDKKEEGIKWKYLPSIGYTSIFWKLLVSSRCLYAISKTEILSLGLSNPESKWETIFHTADMILIDQTVMYEKKLYLTIVSKSEQFMLPDNCPKQLSCLDLKNPENGLKSLDKKEIQSLEITEDE